MIEPDTDNVIFPQESETSLLLGKIVLKLSAHFNVSETAINFFVKGLVDTVHECEIIKFVFG